MQAEYDIVIAGGGMVGASLAIALANTDLNIALIEAVALSSEHQPSYDDRGLALSLSSQRIFDALGIWQKVEMNANPIKRVHVSDRGHFGKVRMDAASMGLEALGHVVIARELGAVLMAQLKQSVNVNIVCPAQVKELRQEPGQISLLVSSEESSHELSCKLLVVADGTQSGLRDQLGIKNSIIDYQQTAIVTNVTPELPHADTAYERFTEFGPLALLPLRQNRCAVVFTVPTEQAEHYLHKENIRFLEDIQSRFGRRLGRLSKAGMRRSYPITQMQAERQHVGRAVLLGNSAHTIHPNGAQGFNLCLRDVAGLAEHVIRGQRKGMDPGSKLLLDDYLLSRQDDQMRVGRLSHNMTEWFYNTKITKSLARNTAMTLLDLFPSAKANLMRRGMGVSGKQPALVRSSEI
ncbi:MAG: 2-octaprenyl-6-methoxyphenol hydroxylase [Gammaproteobacteria bacterium]|jgi:2-octaprenyl-6-methoxyphenol hydroxylase